MEKWEGKIPISGEKKIFITTTTCETSILLNINLIFPFCYWHPFFSGISERNNDYSDTLDFRRWWVGEVRVVTFFVLKIPDYVSAMLIYFYIYIRAFGAPRGSAPMAWYYDSQLRSSLCSLLARCAFGTPKDNGVDASIDIFLVASLEYHLI